MKIKNIIVILALAFLFSGCLMLPERQQQQTPQQNNNPYTTGTAQMSLVRGVTTKTDVAKTFGGPNIVNQNKDGETWIYQKNNITIESTQKGANVTMFMGGVGSVLLGGGAGSAHREKQTYDQSSRTMTLIIEFDKNGVVKDYRTLSTSF